MATLGVGGEALSVSKLEDVMQIGAPSSPECSCGAKMSLVLPSVGPEGRGFRVRAYRCVVCQHEMRVTVWDETSITPGQSSGL